MPRCTKFAQSVESLSMSPPVLKMAKQFVKIATIKIQTIGKFVASADN